MGGMWVFKENKKTKKGIGKTHIYWGSCIQNENDNNNDDNNHDMIFSFCNSLPLVPYCALYCFGIRMEVVDLHTKTQLIKHHQNKKLTRTSGHSEIQ